MDGRSLPFCLFHALCYSAIKISKSLKKKLAFCFKYFISDLFEEESTYLLRIPCMCNEVPGLGWD